MERILVIDDETSICKALKIGLASDNFEIDLAIYLCRISMASK